MKVFRDIHHVLVVQTSATTQLDLVADQRAAIVNDAFEHLVLHVFDTQLECLDLQTRVPFGKAHSNRDLGKQRKWGLHLEAYHTELEWLETLLNGPWNKSYDTAVLRSNVVKEATRYSMVIDPDIESKDGMPKICAADL